MTETRRAIDRRERLIVALDVPTAAEARALVERLGGAASFYKVGLELFSTAEGLALVDWLAGRGHRVFADYKLYDIPETVARATRNLAASGATFLTVHGHRSVMRAAAGAKGRLQILAVTVLTSFDAGDLAEMRSSATVEELVLARAQAALECGCDGVIASGLEAGAVKRATGGRLLVVTPGIRPAGGAAGDQKRVVDVAQAFAYGADYIVVGRPIRDAADPAAAAEAIQTTIASIFES